MEIIDDSNAVLRHEPARRFYLLDFNLPEGLAD